ILNSTPMLTSRYLVSGYLNQITAKFKVNMAREGNDQIQVNPKTDLTLKPERYWKELPPSKKCSG
ncbi:MAG: hypothetical protein KAT81_06300, partial [Syntrophobacterales bacterium]|nr:hypothetical protein [Syntrophobacterales bacterium]